MAFGTNPAGDRHNFDLRFIIASRFSSSGVTGTAGPSANGDRHLEGVITPQTTAGVADLNVKIEFEVLANPAVASG